MDTSKNPPLTLVMSFLSPCVVVVVAILRYLFSLRTFGSRTNPPKRRQLHGDQPVRGSWKRRGRPQAAPPPAHRLHHPGATDISDDADGKKKDYPHCSFGATTTAAEKEHHDRKEQQQQQPAGKHSSMMSCRYVAKARTLCHLMSSPYFRALYFGINVSYQRKYVVGVRVGRETRKGIGGGYLFLVGVDLLQCLIGIAYFLRDILFSRVTTPPLFTSNSFYIYT